MPQPARVLLRQDRGKRPAWALFDADWYRRTYPEAARAGTSPTRLLNYYLTTGARSGHSPSPLFDEKFYLDTNPDIAALIAEGSYQSGFDHFCQHGHRGLSPHWLFDDTLYAEMHDDMTLENLVRYNCLGRYDHWLKSGQRETRTGHFLFDKDYYRARVAAAGGDLDALDADGAFVHYLYSIGGDGPELATSPYFEPLWYLDAHPTARASIAAGTARNALHHYITQGEAAALDPVPEFSEAFLRETYPDIAAAVGAGLYRSAYHHFLRYGAYELRRPRHDIDLVYYRDMNRRVRNDLEAGQVRDAFAHLRTVGIPEDLPYCPPERVPDIAEPAARQLFQLRARNQLALFARQRLDFSHDGAPALAVVMALYEKFDLTMQALASLRANFAGAIELILVDNASTDATSRIGTYVHGARIIRNEENVGFLRACNQGIAAATAPALLFLNNDIELGFGAVATALRRLFSAPDIGAVGGKIIRTHGHLQEAGSIVWADGSTIGYMRDASPLAPEANFVRDVDFCSGVFLLCRTDAVRRLGGFDDAFRPAYYEEVDLCVRMIETGLRIVYDPDIIVHHLEFGSAANAAAAMALMRRGRRTFQQKHRAFLRAQFPQKSGNLVRARARDGAGRRLLFLEDTVPVRRLGSGFVRANDAVRAIAATGWRVSVLPVNGARHDLMSQFGDLPETVEVLHDRSILTLPDLLAERPAFYDAIWVSRTHNLQRTLPIFEAAGIDPADTPFILDTEAVEAARDAAAAALNGETGFDLAGALEAEFEPARICRHVTAVNAAEANLLRGAGLAEVSVLGTIRDPDPTPRPFAARQGLLFVASVHQPDSPNLDSLRWYRDEILPALQALMDHPPALTFIGYTAPDIDLAEFADHPLIALGGTVDDLRPAYDSHRLFVAPTRFAAGTPYKVYETASFGLPCVATELLGRQLGWTPDREIALAPTGSPARFAATIARLYHDEETWNTMREAALARLVAENGRAPFEATVQRVLDGLGAARQKRKARRRVPA